MSVWLTIVLSLISGGGAAAFIEFVLRAGRTREKAARLLMHELNVNRLALELHLPEILVSESTVVMTADFMLSRRIPALLGEGLGELPPTVLSYVLGIYVNFDLLQRLADSYGSLESQARQPLAPLSASEVREEMRLVVTTFKEIGTKTLAAIRGVSERLAPYANDKQWREAQVLEAAR